MISESQAQELIGATAYDADGDKIGKIGQVYFDDQTGHPEWVTVSTGLLGTGETFVPLREAVVEDGDLRVPYAKGQVKDAPDIDDTAHLDPDEEDALWDHYGVTVDDDPTDSPDGAAG